MRKNRNKNQLSREVLNLNRRIDDLANNNYRLSSEKKALVDMKDELTDDNQRLTKECKNIRSMMKLNYLITLLQMNFLNICNDIENGRGWGFKSIIGTYLTAMAQELHKFGDGDLNPALYDPYNNDDDFLYLSDYNEESET